MSDWFDEWAKQLQDAVMQYGMGKKAALLRFQKEQLLKAEGFEPISEEEQRRRLKRISRTIS